MSSPDETTCLCGPDVDKRWFMKSYYHMWLAAVGNCIVVSIASGPIYGWQALEQNMIDEGCRYNLDQLDLMYSIAQGLFIAASFPAGILFDTIGPRMLSVGGILITACGLFGMGVSLMMPHHFNWLLGPSYAITSIFSSVNSWGPYIYLWILVDHPIAVNSMIAASYALADSVALISVALTSCCGVGPGLFYFCTGFLCLGSAAVCYVLLPSRDEALQLKNRVFEAQGLMNGIENGFEIDLKEDVDIKVEELSNIECCGRSIDFFKKERTILYDLAIFIIHIYPGASCLVMAHLCTMYMVVMTLSVNQYAFYLALFHENEIIATMLVDDFLYIYAFAGAVSVIGIGFAFETLGMECLFLFVNVLAFLFFVSVLVHNYIIQIVAMVLFTLLVNLFYVIIVRFAQLYCPHEMFGSYSGVLYLCLGIFQIIFSFLCSSISSYISYPSAIWTYNLQFIFWGVMTILTGIAFFWWLTFKQAVPKTGESTMRAVHSLRAQNVRLCC